MRLVTKVINDSLRLPHNCKAVGVQVRTQKTWLAFIKPSFVWEPVWLLKGPLLTWLVIDNLESCCGPQGVMYNCCICCKSYDGLLRSRKVGKPACESPCMDVALDLWPVLFHLTSLFLSGPVCGWDEEESSSSVTIELNVKVGCIGILWGRLNDELTMVMMFLIGNFLITVGTFSITIATKFLLNLPIQCMAVHWLSIGNEVGATCNEDAFWKGHTN